MSRRLLFNQESSENNCYVHHHARLITTIIIVCKRNKFLCQEKKKVGIKKNIKKKGEKKRGVVSLRQMPRFVVRIYGKHEWSDSSSFYYHHRETHQTPIQNKNKNKKRMIASPNPRSGKYLRPIIIKRELVSFGSGAQPPAAYHLSNSIRLLFVVTLPPHS